MTRLARRIASSVFVLLGVAPCTGCISGGARQPKVTPVAPPAILPTDLRYFLPKTVIVLDLQVERTAQAPGKYCDMLDLFFPELEPVATCQQPPDDAKGKAATLALGARLLAGKMKTSIAAYSVTLKGVPDPDRMFTVKFDSSWHVERADSMNFTEGGLLTGAEIQRTDRTTEIVLGVLSNIARIAGRFVFGVNADALEAAKKAAKRTAPAPWQDIPELKANYDLMTAVRKKAYDDYWNNGKGEGVARLVLATRSYQRLAETVTTLQTVQTNAATGAPAALPDLRKQIDDRLAEDFLGSKSKDVWTPTYEITPQAPGTPLSTYTLFEFAGCGVLAETEKPVKNSLSALRCAALNGATPATLTFTVKTASGGDASRVRADETKQSDSVLYYIRPEPVLVNLADFCAASVALMTAKSDSDPTIAAQSSSACGFKDSSLLLAQWGTRGEIPKAGKDFSYNVAFYEATGAIKSLKLTSKAALDAVTIDKAFGIATTLLDAKDAADAEKKKKADEAAAKADELNVLTRKRQILEETAKIKKLCAEIGATTCES